MFYNVENLFHPSDLVDSIGNKLSDSVHPGLYSFKRFNHKTSLLSKVISAAGEWGSVDILGIAEVSSTKAVDNIVSKLDKRTDGMEFVVSEGADKRGIRTALLHRPASFFRQGVEEFRITPPKDASKTTRPILHSWGTIADSLRLDFFVCHFPSRYGGEKESESFRFAAAERLREVCDSIYASNPRTYIIIMGDFNDAPSNKSMRHKLSALPYESCFSEMSADGLSLVNLFLRKKPLPVYSHKYQGEWSQLDQFVVSSNFLAPNSPLSIDHESVRVFSPDFLLTKDKTWGGFRPRRSYYGYKYEAGFSDHLPILMDLLIAPR
jgi:hypothetical protein